MGEVVVFDRRGVSRFQLLQQNKGEPILALFDCLDCDGKDLLCKPLSERRHVLVPAIPSSKGVLLLSRLIAKNGLDAYKIAAHRRFERLVAKDLSSPYVEERSGFWLKVKVRQEGEFAIVGFTTPQGSRKYFGALLLGAHENGKLRYAGKVGTGFSEEVLVSLHEKFQPLVRSTSVLVNASQEHNTTFIAPRFVAQISYQQWTAGRRLRQAVFLRLRDDKLAKDVVLPKVDT
jgi:bifunctional non-homologous end joining protein LigD